jgi:transaldolase
MMLFLDTANIRDIENFLTWGCFHGCTTNPKIVSQSGEKYSKEAYHRGIRRICELVNGPVSVELSGSVLGAIEEAQVLRSLADNVVVKVPMWPNGAGMKIISLLVEKDIPVNATVLMKGSQAILAAEAGAEYVSLFYRRMIDTSSHDATKYEFGMARDYLDAEKLHCKIIAGSIRQGIDVTNAFKLGADIVTIPPKILTELVNNDATDKTIAEFDRSWKEYIGASS